MTDWSQHYQQASRAPARADAAPAATNEEQAFLAWSDRCDADEQSRDEKGQLASGSGGASARASAKEAVGHVQALRAIAAKSGNPDHAAALAHAEKAAKGARSSARKAEVEPDAAASNAHAAKAAVHAQTAKGALNQVQGIADRTAPKYGGGKDLDTHLNNAEAHLGRAHHLEKSRL